MQGLLVWSAPGGTGIHDGLPGAASQVTQIKMQTRSPQVLQLAQLLLLQRPWSVCR
jgi:hypothetical protein